jgi:hypothetical protein
MEKCLRLQPEDIKPLVEVQGSCIASDRITVDGTKIGYMVRTDPVAEADSGWCFFAGDENAEYTATTDFFGVYEVNTVANYDAEIIPYLDSPAPCAFVRDASGNFVAVAPRHEA